VDRIAEWVTYVAGLEARALLAAVRVAVAVV
jgi:hypothetical protein